MKRVSEFLGRIQIVPHGRAYTRTYEYELDDDALNAH